MVVPLSFESPFVLGSTSPRRKELLSSIVSHFDLESPDIEEIWNKKTNSIEEGVMDLAIQKNMALFEEESEKILLTADTVVVVENQILGKPKNEDEAVAFLERLSAKQHSVYTGVCIQRKEVCHTFFEETKVTFYSLSREIIAHYVHQYKPMDKAGAYGIQEWIGTVGIEQIEGCFQNVIGLPIPKLLRELVWLKQQYPDW